MQHFSEHHRTRRGRPVSLVLAGSAALGLAVLAAGHVGAMAPAVGDPADARRRAADIDLLVQDLLDDAAPPVAEGGGEEIPLATLKFFIEFNETDEDVGVQTLLGGEPYKRLRAYDPNDRRIVDLRPRRSLARQGMSDFFFESAEPSLDETPMSVFLARFPVGDYEFETVTLDNLEQEGETLFTHEIPAGPEITVPQEGDVVDRDNLVIEWEPVTMTTAYNPPQRPVNIVRYQVIVTLEDPLMVYSVDVPADVTAVSVPPEFLLAETEYELEVIAVEESDNQTISIIFFETE